MWQVKLFDEETEGELEEAINSFISSDVEELKDIKYQVSSFIDNDNDQVFCFSAMIIYK